MLEQGMDQYDENIVPSADCGPPPPPTSWEPDPKPRLVDELKYEVYIAGVPVRLEVLQKVQAEPEDLTPSVSRRFPRATASPSELASAYFADT
jgi:hypothetical protein